MLEVNIFDKNFKHTIKTEGFDTASSGRKPTLIKWVREKYIFDGPTIFTEAYILKNTHIIDKVKSKYKIAWLQESPAIAGNKVIEKIKKIENKFDFILTHSEVLVQSNPSKYKLCPNGSTRVPDENWAVHKKNKLVSMIVSRKKKTYGHKFRYKITRKLGSKIDLYGHNYHRFDSKIIPLKDYYFSIAVMNCRSDNYFTEILIDCFALGTIPVFWGASNIDKFFNIDGILQFEKIGQLIKILSCLNPNEYFKRISAIQENFDIAKNYVSTDDNVAKILIDILNK